MPTKDCPKDSWGKVKGSDRPQGKTLQNSLKRDTRDIGLAASWPS